jgi:transaldolase/glucose-6-phosphate isomerase
LRKNWKSGPPPIKLIQGETMTKIKEMTGNPLKRALAFGQSFWYDGLIGKDDFEKMIREDGIRGATTNPAIFEKSIATGEYDAAIRKMASKSEAEIYKAIAVEKVKSVCDFFMPLYVETRGTDGFVSIEVSPLLAYDTAGTIEEARELYRLVDRKNVMIKIPATREGLPAIKIVIADGIHVNVTLIFSVERYRDVMRAFIQGLEERLAQGKPVDGIASVASFFVSRVDSAIDKTLQDRITQTETAGEKSRLSDLLGKAAIANSKLAYAAYTEVFGGSAFKGLRQKGAQAQRPLWASTGTKNPLYSDVLYVEELIGENTVNTMPPPTMDAYRDHGNPASRLEFGMDEARKVLADVKAQGVELSQVTESLEKAGVESFADSFKKIIQMIGAKTK